MGHCCRPCGGLCVWCHHRHHPRPQLQVVVTCSSSFVGVSVLAVSACSLHCSTPNLALGVGVLRSVVFYTCGRVLSCRPACLPFVAASSVACCCFFVPFFIRLGNTLCRPCAVGLRACGCGPAAPCVHQSSADLLCVTVVVVGLWLSGKCVPGDSLSESPSWDHCNYLPNDSDHAAKHSTAPQQHIITPQAVCEKTHSWHLSLNCS